MESDYSITTKSCKCYLSSMLLSSLPNTELNLKSLLRRRTKTEIFFIHDLLTDSIKFQIIRDRINLNHELKVLR